MIHTPFLRRARRSAITLAATMMVVAAVVTFLSIAAFLTSQYGRFVGRSQGTGMESVVCDAALEYVFAAWKTKIKASGGSVAPLPSEIIDSDATQAGRYFVQNYFPNAAQLGVDENSLKIYLFATDQNGQNDTTIDTTGMSVVSGIPSTGKPTSFQTKNVASYPGWTGYTYNYMAWVVAKSNRYGQDANNSFQARRFFQMTRLPLCQGLGFYQGNMEIHPGATMILSGTIHSNKNIYAQGMGAYLQFKNNVSYSGQFIDGSSNPDVKKGWDGTGNGNVNASVYAPYFPNLYADGKPDNASPYAQGVPALLNADGKNHAAVALPASSSFPTQVNQVAAIDPFGGASTNNNGLHDIIEVPTNNTSDQIAYNNAALFIEVNSAAITSQLPGQIPALGITIKVADSSGNLVPVTSGTDYNNIMQAINNGKVSTVFDKREGANAVMTNLDMNLLDVATTMPKNTKNATPLQIAFAQKDASGNYVRDASNNIVQTGTVYIHDKASKTSATRPAIRLTNGRNLGQNVSVATDNGLYIQGDYNTGGNAYTDVPANQANSSTTADPQAPGYTRYAASVMADAVTILSNGWNDSKAGLSLSNRPALPTTVNTAILSGDVASNTGGAGYASGGLHNFPRFLENWTNVNFTYYGSLIQAYNSEEFTGNWQTNDVYHWPNRLWNFDANFLQVQPPGMPQGLVFSRGRWEHTYNSYKNKGQDGLNPGEG